MLIEAIIFKGLGVLGLLIITSAIFAKKETKQDWLFVVGGLCLLAYSSYLHDPIFIVLQIVFTLSSLYELYKLRKASGQFPMPVSAEEVEKLLRAKK